MRSRNARRHGIRYPAAETAKEMNAPTFANRSMTGRSIRETGAVSFGGRKDVLKKLFPQKHTDMPAGKLNAIKAGYEYER